MDVLNFLSSNNYIALNRDVIKLFGLNEAILLCELCGEYSYWNNKGKLEDGYFYSTIENIEEQTGLSRYQQDNALYKLEEQGIVEKVKKGLPAKRYIKINLEKLKNILNDKIDLSKLDKLNLPKVTTPNNSYKNNKYNSKEKYIKESSKLNDRNFVSYLDIRISDEDRNNPNSEIF